MDKLDGRIDGEFFDRKAAEFRQEQSRIKRDIEAHRIADQAYVEEGIKLLELAHSAHRQFENQPAAEKRKLLDFVLWNCTWEDGELRATYRQPFDLIAAAAQADGHAKGSGNPDTGNFDNWRRKRDSNPRGPYDPNGFQDRRLRPLGHSSAHQSSGFAGGPQCCPVPLQRRLGVYSENRCPKTPNSWGIGNHLLMKVFPPLWASAGGRSYSCFWRWRGCSPSPP